MNTLNHQFSHRQAAHTKEESIPTMRCNACSKSPWGRYAFSLLFLALSFQLISAKLHAKAKTQWENQETEKLLKSALGHIEKGKTTEAIQELSEIIEFFPKSQHWNDACTQLSDLHLLNKNVDASHELLTRYEERIQPNALKPSKLLFAFWDYYAKQSQYKELASWLKQLKPKECEQLRQDKSLITRLSTMSSKTDVELMLDTYQLLGYNDPLAEILSLINRSGFVFDQYKQKKILNKLILIDNSSGISQMSRIMSNAGWNETADEIFKKHSSEKEPKWLRTWINVLIEGKLWKRALSTLKKYPNDEYQKDLVIVYSGLGSYQKAYTLMLESKKWIFSTLTLEDITTIIEGLGRESFNQSMKEDLLKKMPDGDKKHFIKASMIGDHTKRLTALNEIIKGSSLYIDRAWFEIAKLHYDNRRTEELKKNLTTLESNFPKSIYIERTRDLLKTLTSIKNETVEK